MPPGTLPKIAALLQWPVMSPTVIHIVFDCLAWLTSLATLLILRRTWFADPAVAPPLRFGYVAALVAGAGLGSWLMGTVNLWVTEMPGFGRSIAGALGGAILAIEIYKKTTGITVRTGAVYALPLVLGIAIGRIGCLFAGLDDFTYGIPTNANWGWDFGDGMLRHPVQLYETLAMAAFALFYFTRLRRNDNGWKQNGFYFAVTYYALERLILEFLKPYGTVFFGLSVFQLLCLFLLTYGLLMARTNAR